MGFPKPKMCRTSAGFKLTKKILNILKFVKLVIARFRAVCPSSRRALTNFTDLNGALDHLIEVGFFFRFEDLVAESLFISSWNHVECRSKAAVFNGYSINKVDKRVASELNS